MRCEVSIATDRDVLQKIFAPVHSSPWEKFPRAVLQELDLDGREHVFWLRGPDLLAGVLYRSQPRDDRYQGNFACNKPMLEFLALQERAEKIQSSYLLTVESLNEGKILSIARACEVADRVLGHIEPFTSASSGEPYYWLDADMFPARLRYGRRPFRMLQEVPEFLRTEGFQGGEYC